MKLYAYSLRRKPGSEELVPYRCGPFANYTEWMKFLHTKPGRNLELNHVMVDEGTATPTVWHPEGIWTLKDFRLPYPCLISKYDGALLTGDGKVIFAGPSQPQ